VDQAFGAKLVSYERLKDLTGFAGERKGEWPSWASSVKQGIEQSAPALEQSRKALAECWEEIAEKAGTTSISVRATNVGQTIVAPVERRTVKKQGVT
jgi:NAD-dependent oxidoreductase involved in siderophore biosynthesis